MTTIQVGATGDYSSSEAEGDLSSRNDSMTLHLSNRKRITLCEDNHAELDLLISRKFQELGCGGLHIHHRNDLWQDIVKLDKAGAKLPEHSATDNLFNSCLDCKLIEILIKNGADVNHLSENRGSPLHHAVRNEDDEKGGNIINALIKNGADVNVKDRLDVTPLYLAYQIRRERKEARPDTIRALRGSGGRQLRSREQRRRDQRRRAREVGHVVLNVLGSPFTGALSCFRDTFSL